MTAFLIAGNDYAVGGIQIDESAEAVVLSLEFPNRCDQLRKLLLSANVQSKADFFVDAAAFIQIYAGFNEGKR